MGAPPRFIVWTHVVFNVSVVVGCAFGLLFIWDPPESVLIQKAFGSVLVIFVASTLLLAGYRTVHWWPRREG